MRAKMLWCWPEKHNTEIIKSVRDQMKWKRNTEKMIRLQKQGQWSKWREKKCVPKT